MKQSVPKYLSRAWQKYHYWLQSWCNMSRPRLKFKRFKPWGTLSFILGMRRITARIRANTKMPYAPTIWICHNTSSFRSSQFASNCDLYSLSTRSLAVIFNVFLFLFIIECLVISFLSISNKVGTRFSQHNAQLFWKLFFSPKTTSQTWIFSINRDIICVNLASCLAL